MKNIKGIVTKIKNNTELDKVSDIISVQNSNISLNEELLELGKFIKDNTFCTLIKAYQTYQILPFLILYLFFYLPN